MESYIEIVVETKAKLGSPAATDANATTAPMGRAYSMGIWWGVGSFFVAVRYSGIQNLTAGVSRSYMVRNNCFKVPR
jgi:hypothetical protein